MQLNNTKDYATQLDATNVLGAFRSQFIIPEHHGGEATYFLGNSLGLQPKTTAPFIADVLNQWSRYGVEAFFKGGHPWLGLHQLLQPALAAIVGAMPEEVAVMNQLTVNLHLLLVSFYRPDGIRKKILCEAKAFPSDQYMLFSHVQQRGLDPTEVIVEVKPADGETLIREEDILAAIEQHKDELALVFFGGVNYYTGQLFDIGAITRAAQQAGAMAGFDLAHAAGNVPLQLHDDNVDFAAWCSYKYLNSGPGAVAGAFVHERYHNNNQLDRFAGWWGNKSDTQFLMRPQFEPQPSAAGWQLSTPSPVLFAAHKAALDIFEAAGIQNVFAGNKKLTAFVYHVLEHVIAATPPGSLHIITPKKEAQRGCQVSMVVKKGKAVFDAITAAGVYADWREPDVIRIAPVALYNTFEEVWFFGQALQQAIIKISS